jgi:hypothetical protein
MVQMNYVGVYRQENGKFSVDSMCRALIQPGLIKKMENEDSIEDKALCMVSLQRCNSHRRKPCNA